MHSFSFTKIFSFDIDGDIAGGTSYVIKNMHKPQG